MGHGAEKELRTMETYKKQKSRCQVCLFLFINNVDLKNNNRNYKKHSGFSGCANSCNKIVFSRF